MGVLETTNTATNNNTNTNQNMAFIKVAFKDELRRVAFAPENGLQGLQEALRILFGLKSFALFQLTYQDSEGDTLVLSSTEELNQLVANCDTPKLSLTPRKVCKPIRFGIRMPTPIVKSETSETSLEDSKQAPPEEEKIAPQEVKTATANVGATEEAPKEKESKATKRCFKEKRALLKEQTTTTKVVRLRWRQANPNYKPQEVTEGERAIWRQKKLASKGCYLSATLKGKIKFNCGIGRKGLWFCHELTNGDRMFAPVSAPSCYLRVHPDGSVNISSGGFGQKTRWGFNPLTGESHFGGRLVSRASPNLHLVAVLVGKKRKCQSEQKKERVEARGLDLTASTPENLIGSEFAIEEVDPVQVLKWMAVRKAGKKRANHQAEKENKKAKQLKKRERRQDGEVHAHARRARKGQAFSVVFEAVSAPTIEQQPQQTPSTPQQVPPVPHPHLMRPFVRPPGLLRHHFRHLPHGPFNANVC